MRKLKKVHGLRYYIAGVGFDVNKDGWKAVTHNNMQQKIILQSVKNDASDYVIDIHHDHDLE